MARMFLSRWMPGLLAATLLASACGGGVPVSPSNGAVATFTVSGETFRVLLTSADQIAAARAALNGATARIPNGRIVPGTQVNTGWSWHLEDVEFAAVTIELCDGRPSDVERDGPSYAGGRFCPWGASIVRIDAR